VGNTSTTIAGNPKYDMATAKWGKGWRLPTQAEFEEMIAASGRNWTYDDSSGVKKYIATFPNGKTLDLPHDGYMNSSKTEKFYPAHLFYWTSEATTADSAQMPYCMNADGPRSFEFIPTEKYKHLMIRPVYDNSNISRNTLSKKLKALKTESEVLAYDVNSSKEGYELHKNLVNKYQPLYNLYKGCNNCNTE